LVLKKERAGYSGPFLLGGHQELPRLYAEGGHAFGLRRPDLPIGGWPELVDKWLRTIGMLSKRE
jgi:hypothetical protein